MINKVRFETENGRTRVWLDDTEVKGCTSANFSYDVNEIPVVQLNLVATDVTVNIDCADVCKKIDEQGDENSNVQFPN